MKYVIVLFLINLASLAFANRTCNACDKNGSYKSAEQALVESLMQLRNADSATYSMGCIHESSLSTTSTVRYQIKADLVEENPQDRFPSVIPCDIYLWYYNGERRKNVKVLLACERRRPVVQYVDAINLFDQTLLFNFSPC